MLHANFGVAETTAVNNALDLIEAELKPALMIAAERLNAVLATYPDDTAVVHSHLSDVHALAARIDKNIATRRQHQPNR